MKISKLFHWLYAIVMLLPILYVFSRCAYAIWNENAVLQTGTLDNIFLDSVNSINDVALFSWAQTSFIVVPFSYITTLFGLASSSPINTLLSYWASISVIWLTFDIILYVPMLAHRWLDRGSLQ